MKRNVECAPVISDRIRDFLDEKQASGLSLPTLENYTTSLRLFLRDNSLSGSEPVTVLTKELIQNWITEMIEEDVNSNSLKHKVREVRVFCYWLMDNNDLPFYKIKLPTLQEQDNTKRYTEEELTTLLSLPEHTDEYWKWRDWLLANIFTSTGARIGSICYLKKQDITDTTITFTKTKNKKILTLPLSPSLKQAINKYCREWNIDSEYLLLSSRSGNLLNSRSAYHSFQKYCSLRGVEFKGLHSFRHSVAFTLYKQGVDIVTLSYLLGHSDIGITRAYIGRLCGTDLPEFTNLLDKLTSKKKPKVTRNR